MSLLKKSFIAQKCKVYSKLYIYSSKLLLLVHSGPNWCEIATLNQVLAAAAAVNRIRSSPGRRSLMGNKTQCWISCCWVWCLGEGWHVGTSGAPGMVPLTPSIILILSRYLYLLLMCGLHRAPIDRETLNHHSARAAMDWTVCPECLSIG